MPLHLAHSFYLYEAQLRCYAFGIAVPVRRECMVQKKTWWVSQVRSAWKRIRNVVLLVSILAVIRVQLYVVLVVAIGSEA